MEKNPSQDSIQVSLRWSCQSTHDWIIADESDELINPANLLIVSASNQIYEWAQKYKLQLFYGIAVNIIWVNKLDYFSMEIIQFVNKSYQL